MFPIFHLNFIFNTHLAICGGKNENALVFRISDDLGRVKSLEFQGKDRKLANREKFKSPRSSNLNIAVQTMKMAQSKTFVAASGKFFSRFRLHAVSSDDA